MLVQIPSGSVERSAQARPSWVAARVDRDRVGAEPLRELLVEQVRAEGSACSRSAALPPASRPARRRARARSRSRRGAIDAAAAADQHRAPGRSGELRPDRPPARRGCCPSRLAIAAGSTPSGHRTQHRVGERHPDRVAEEAAVVGSPSAARTSPSARRARSCRCCPRRQRLALAAGDLERDADEVAGLAPVTASPTSITSATHSWPNGNGSSGGDEAARRAAGRGRRWRRRAAARSPRRRPRGPAPRPRATRAFRPLRRSAAASPRARPARRPRRRRRVRGSSGKSPTLRRAISSPASINAVIVVPIPSLATSASLS